MIIFLVLPGLKAGHTITQLTGDFSDKHLSASQPNVFTEILWVACMQKSTQPARQPRRKQWMATDLWKIITIKDRDSPFCGYKRGMVIQPLLRILVKGICTAALRGWWQWWKVFYKVLDPSTCCNCWISPNNLWDVGHTFCAPQLMVNLCFGLLDWKSRGTPK